jgi:hypothetical protein
LSIDGVAIKTIAPSIAPHGLGAIGGILLVIGRTPIGIRA